MLSPAPDSQAGDGTCPAPQVARHPAAEPIPVSGATREPAVDGTAPAWGLIRPASALDLPLVLESWTGTWKRSDWAGCVQNHTFDEVHRATILALIQRGARVLVLANPDRPEQVLAWVCFELRDGDLPAVHYVFCKRPFRCKGLATTLLASVGIEKGRFVYTHKTHDARFWPRAKFCPAIARRKER